jgi:hypothetical protein
MAALMNVHLVTDPPTVALAVPPTTAHDRMHPNPTQRPSLFLPGVLQHLLQKNLSPTRPLKPTQLLSMMLLPLPTTAHFKPFFFVATMTTRQKNSR